jgi:hypothetical protein
VFATPEDGFSDASSSVVTKRPISPKIKSYPFQTELAKMVSSTDQKQHTAEASASPSVAKGRKPPPSSSSTLQPQTQQPQQARMQEKEHEQEQEHILQREYVPLLQELTDATNSLLNSYGTVAKEFNQQSQRNHQNKKENTHFMNNWKSSLLEELGVDVDPVYNARVKYGRAVTMLIYYTITIKLKFAMSQWKQFTTATNRQRRFWAGSLLVRIARGMLSRNSVRQMKFLRQKQKEAEEEYERQRMVFRSYMCYKITKAWRRYQKRKQRKLRERRRRACVLIQARARGMLARAHVRWLRNYRQQCWQSSIAIQCAYRIHLAKRKVPSPPPLLPPALTLCSSCSSASWSMSASGNSVELRN